MMNWGRYGSNQSWCILRHSASICLKEQLGSPVSVHTSLAVLPHDVRCSNFKIVLQVDAANLDEEGSIRRAV